MAYPALTDNEVPSQASAPHILTPSPSRGSSPAPSFRRLDSVTWRQTLASNVNGSQVWDLSFPGVDGGGVQERGEAASANSSGMANRLSQLSRAETLVGNMEAGSPQGKGGEVALDSRTGSIGGSGHSRPGAGGRPALKFGSALWRRAGRLRRWLRWLLTRERFHLVIVALVVRCLLSPCLQKGFRLTLLQRSSSSTSSSSFSSSLLPCLLVLCLRSMLVDGELTGRVDGRLYRRARVPARQLTLSLGASGTNLTYSYRS